MKFKLISNGTVKGTKIIDEDTGEDVGMKIQRVEVDINAPSSYVNAVVTFIDLPMDLSGLDSIFNNKLDQLVDKSRQEMQVIMGIPDDGEKHYEAVSRLSALFGEIKYIIGKKH